MKTIFFVRHGESESNIANIVSGSGNDIHLTARGRQQAKKAGQELKQYNIELIVCSPMIRTVDTANIIAEQIGYNSNRIIQNPLLVERTYGIYEGLPSENYRAALASGKVHASVETEEQMYKRFSKVLVWLKNLPQNRIAIISHGGARRAIHVINENLHHSHMYKLESFPNGGIYEFNL
jgi:uncharacterized phosphatase